MNRLLYKLGNLRVTEEMFPFMKRIISQNGLSNLYPKSMIGLGSEVNLIKHFLNEFIKYFCELGHLIIANKKIYRLQKELPSKQFCSFRFWSNCQ
jgi:hypothetical protein